MCAKPSFSESVPSKIAPSKASDHPESFFKTTRPLLILGQWFALFPSLSGLHGPNHMGLKSCWRSWSCFYAVYAYLGLAMTLVCFVEPLLNRSLSYDGFSGIYFYMNCLVTSLFLNFLSKRWVILCEQFGRMEMLLLRHGYPQLSFKFRLVMVVFVFSATVEHLSALVQTFVRILPCADTDGGWYSLLDAFFRNNYPKVVGYNFWMGVVIFHLNLLFTFWWNFPDLLLAFVSMSLSARFDQINQFLSKHRWQARSSSFWRRARGEFNCLARLTRSVDSSLGVLVTLSFLNNVIYICQQLLRSLHPRRNWFQSFYFGWSFGYLLLRAIFASLSMAEIHSCGKKFKSVLFCIPSRSYCGEAERFLFQVEADDVSLTGCGLFTASRATLLTIAGTIVTYEIILLQFNIFLGVDNWPTQNNKTFCF